MKLEHIKEWKWSQCSICATHNMNPSRQYWKKILLASSVVVMVFIAEIIIFYHASTTSKYRYNAALRNWSIPAFCLLPKDEGVQKCPENETFFRWYFDTNVSQCLFFTYFKCRGNKNRFDSKEDCETLCTDGNRPSTTTEKPLLKPIIYPTLSPNFERTELPQMRPLQWSVPK